MKSYNFFLLFFISMCVCIVAQADSKIQLKKTELNQINGQIQQLQKTLAEDQQHQSDLQQQLKTAEMNINELSLQVDEFNEAYQREQDELTNLKNAEQNAMNKIAQHRAALSQQLAAAYQLGHSPSFKLLLNHQDPNTLSRHLTYYRYLSLARVHLMNDIQQTVSELAENVREMKRHQANLKKLLLQKQQQQAQEEQAQATRQRLISLLGHSVQSKQQRMNVLLSNQRALQQLISQLQIQPEMKYTIQPSNTGKPSWPLKGAITSHFGSALDVGEERLSGVIIQAPEGAPVHAVYPGKVIFSNWLRGFGLLIIINHGNGYMSLYARNHSLHTKVGDRVSQGDVIATTGNSGGFNTAGLYFEIRHNGVPINPSTWCR